MGVSPMRFAIHGKQNRRPGGASPRTWSRVLAVGLAAGVLWAGAVAADSIVTPDGVEYEDVYIRATEHLYYIQVPDSGEIITVRRDEVGSDDVRIHPDPDHREQLLRDWHEARGLERADPEARVEERIEEVTPEEPIVEPPEPAIEAQEEAVTPEAEPEEPMIAPPLEDIGAPDVEPELDVAEPAVPEMVPQPEVEEPIIDQPLDDLGIPGFEDDFDEPAVLDLPDAAPEIEAEEPMIDEPLDDLSVPDVAPLPGDEDVVMDEDVAVDDTPIAEPRDSIEIYVPEGERRDSAEDRRRLMEIRQMFRQMQMGQQPGMGGPGQQPGMGGPGQQPGMGGPGQQPGMGRPGQQPGMGGPQQQPGGPGGPQQQPGAPGPEPGGPGGEEGAPAPPPPEGGAPE